MKVSIVTHDLKVEALDGDNWRLLEPLVFVISCAEHPEPFVVVVPGGYVTDFESVPKVLVFAYLLIKGRFRRAATGHDYLIDLIQGEVEEKLRTSLLPFRPTRAWIDEFFLAAMKAEGELREEKQPVRDWLARNTAYAGVSVYTLFTGE